jgi:hypothetical protein
MTTFLLEFSYKNDKQKVNVTIPSFVWNWEKRELEKKEKSIEVKKWQKGDDSQKIKDWIKENIRRLDFEINNDETSSKAIAIDFEENVKSQIEYSLDRQGIRYVEI